MDTNIAKSKNTNSSIVSEKSGLCSCERGNRTWRPLTKRTTSLPDLSPQDEFAPKIGIVIPIYNTAPYLRECLDSVANQTYKNFHAVLVNDGSSDDSLKIALEYVAKDSRFVLIDKENGGQSSARNAGIAYFNDANSACGDFSQVVHSAHSLQRTPSASHSFASHNHENSRTILEFAVSKNNSTQGVESSKNTNKNPIKSFCYFWLSPKVESPLPLNPNLSIARSATKSRPIRGAKNRIQTSGSASADFLLEKDLRGTPPKSEKRQLLARRGSGAGGAALLRKEKGDRDSIDSKADLSIESHKKIDSNLPLDSRDLDSSRCRAQNDESTDSLNLSQKDESTQTPPKIDYIIFLDSDDFWAVDLLEKCVDSVRIAQQSNRNLDIVWFDWNEIYADSGRIQGKTTMELFGFATQTQITAKQWLIQAQEKRINSFWWAWQGLISFDYLRRVNLRFLEGVIFEDNLFGVLLFSQCESIAIVPCKLYNYRIRKHSTTNNSAKSLPPFIADLRAHFSTDSKAWAYFCAYSLCAMSLEFANFCANLSKKNRAKPREYGESKLCESIFLPNFLAESCDILAFSSDPLNAKSRFIALLKKRGKYAPYLKIIAHIVPCRFKRLRYALFLFYFAPKFAFFRALRKISRALGFGDG